MVNFYGTTFTGGTSDGGTAFRVSPEGAIETLHSSHAQRAYFACLRLARGSDDNFYGTTGSSGAQGHGIVFSDRCRRQLQRREPGDWPPQPQFQ